MLKRISLFCLLLTFIFLGCTESVTKVLIFSKTAGYRHESIEAGIQMFKSLAEENNFVFDTTEDSTFFTSENLKPYKSIVFLNTTGDVFNSEQQTAFENYIKSGGGFLGIHSAADTEYEWPWYGELVGAYFNGHPNNPNVRKATITKTNNKHDCTNHLPENWERADEWYNYKNINPRVLTLLNLEESSYEGGTNGAFHPIAWCHEFQGGRAAYTGGGHTKESYEEPAFVQHVLKALKWTIAK